MAINQVGNALANSGSTFASDDDPELIRDAAPFSLKLMESLLAESPKHEGLLLAAAQGFAQYSYAFVQQEADKLEDTDFSAAEIQRTRARKLYLRARDYGLRGLEVRHPNWRQELMESPGETVKKATRKDVPLLYWTAAAWGAAISVSKDQPKLISDQDIVAALLERALELDEAYDQGTIHAYMIAFEMGRANEGGDPAARAHRHFERALELSKGRLAAPLVAYAESVSVTKQNKAEFETLLQQALAIDPDGIPEGRLANLITQNRARWLLSRKDDLFF